MRTYDLIAVAVGTLAVTGCADSQPRRVMMGPVAPVYNSAPPRVIAGPQIGPSVVTPRGAAPPGCSWRVVRMTRPSGVVVERHVRVCA